MNKIYDNGYKIIGNVYNVKDYVCKNADNLEEIKYLINDLENLDEQDIVVIDYDNAMGYTIDYWKNKDEVMEVLI